MVGFVSELGLSGFMKDVREAIFLVIMVWSSVLTKLNFLFLGAVGGKEREGV